MNSSLRIIGLVIARDEWPLLRLSITHALLNHVDHVWVLDHSSGDGTRDGLERLTEIWGERLRVVRLCGTPFWQEASTSLILELIGATRDDWIYVFDADEFAITRSGTSIREILGSVGPDFSSVRYEVDNWISTATFDECDHSQYSQLRLRAIANHFFDLPSDILSDEIQRGTLNFFDVPFPSKVIVRGGGPTWLSAGAHLLKQPVAGEEFRLCPRDFRVAHFPLLSEQRLHKKAAHGELLVKQGFPTWHGWQNQMLFRLSSTGQLSNFWKRHSVGAPEADAYGTTPSIADDSSFVEAIAPTLAFLAGTASDEAEAHHLLGQESGDTLVSASAAIGAIRSVQMVADAIAAEQDRQVANSSLRVDQLERENSVLRQALEESEKRCRAMQSSTSWLLTRPVRAIGQLLK